MQGVSSAKQRFEGEWRALETSWYRLADVWRDQAFDALKRDHWQPLAAASNHVEAALEELYVVIEQARREIP